jgi:hypothetical protein
MGQWGQSLTPENDQMWEYDVFHALYHASAPKAVGEKCDSAQLTHQGCGPQIRSIAVGVQLARALSFE